MRLHPLKTKLWRAVEDQHRVSTLRLVDHDPADHEALEALLEQSKPPLPPPPRLHYLLATPFRYPPHRGSRFRGPHDPGVFYGAEFLRTACAELGYWRWRFVQASQGLRELNATPHTLFQVAIETRGLDLRRPPYRQHRSRWTHPEDYAPTQALAREARQAQAGALLYESVRDPEHAACAAVFSPAAFRPLRPLAEQRWFLTVTPSAALWTRDKVEFQFPFSPCAPSSS